MSKLLATVYGALVYCFFLITFLYAIGFVGNFLVPKSIDTGASTSLGQALFIDAILLGMFAAQHSVMARPGFKRWWAQLVPKYVERSTYVLCASLILALLFWQWRPISTLIWSVTDSFWVATLDVICGLGWAMVLLSTFLINHFELFGLTQVVAHFRGGELSEPVFRTPFLYRWIRHPLYLGFLLAFWATPAMSAGHLLFAVATSGYILLGIFLEERDLITQFGDRYRSYRASAGMLIPRIQRNPARKD
jgi:methanethiol S-methyltransferase